MDVSGSMRHQGVISSDGNPGICHATGSASGGGGAAGSVLIYCPQINGSGILSAIGGAVLSGCDRSFSGGGGGGGRIAVYTVPTARGLTLRYSAFGGVSSGCTQGGAGTVYYNHTQTLYIDQGYSPPSVTQKLLAKNFVPYESMTRIGSRDLPTSHNLSNALKCVTRVAVALAAPSLMCVTGTAASMRRGLRCPALTLLAPSAQ